jgi:hypothetical protein
MAKCPPFWGRHSFLIRRKREFPWSIWFILGLDAGNGSVQLIQIVGDQMKCTVIKAIVIEAALGQQTILLEKWALGVI